MCEAEDGGENSSVREWSDLENEWAALQSLAHETSSAAVAALILAGAYRARCRYLEKQIGKVRLRLSCDPRCMIDEHLLDELRRRIYRGAGGSSGGLNATTVAQWLAPEPPSDSRRVATLVDSDDEDDGDDNDSDRSDMDALLTLSLSSKNRFAPNACRTLPKK